MYKLFLQSALVAVLFLISSISILGQEPRPTRSCAEDTFVYPDSPRHYVYDPIARKNRRRIDQAVAYARRLDLTFRPKYVSVIQGKENVIFDGIDKSATWYAIYHYAGPEAPGTGTHLLPIPADKLPSDTREYEAQPIPPYHFSFKGVPEKPALPPTIKSTVKKLPASMDLDTTDWPLGYYWFTLQSEFGSGDQRCYRTTPPVVIQITPYIPPPPVNHRPTISVEASSIPCKSVSAVARVSDPDAPPQTLTVKWRILDQNSIEITPDYTSPDGKTVTISSNLKTGTYKFLATVTDSDPEHPLSAGDDDSVDYICAGGGAGIAYFQFAVPFEKKYLDITDPESWVGGDPKRVNDPNDPYSTPYPQKHFTLFFEKTTAQDPPSNLEKSNTRMLDKIVDVLHSYPDYYLKIFGYADFRKTGKYDNNALGQRRINAVIAYLVDAYEKKYNENIADRIKQKIVLAKSYGDSKAQTCDPNNWAEQRRWDRRVQIIFMRPDQDIPAPEYPDSLPCPKKVK